MDQLSVKEKILLIEDDESICKTLKATLQQEGYDVSYHLDGDSASKSIQSSVPDLIILDLGLPDMDGAEILTWVRTWSYLPILVLSGRIDDAEKVKVLDLGADDYIVKPVANSELLARVRAAIRHTRTTSNSEELALNGTLVIGELMIDFVSYRVKVNNVDAKLTPTEYKLLTFLARSHGGVVTYNQCLQELWGPLAVGSDNKILRVYMTNIRKKIDYENNNDFSYIKTEAGIGYRLSTQEDYLNALNNSRK